jgi:hypothetical protein
LARVAVFAGFPSFASVPALDGVITVTGAGVGGTPESKFPSPESRLLLTSLFLLASLMFIAFLLTSFLFLVISLFRVSLLSLASLA